MAATEMVSFSRYMNYKRSIQKMSDSIKYFWTIDMYTGIQLDLSEYTKLKTFKSEESFLVIEPQLKHTYLSHCSNSPDSEDLLIKNELVYSDNLEDIDTQLLFYGFKIIKSSKQDLGYFCFYNLESI